jgi:hypothetical protein
MKNFAVSDQGAIIQQGIATTFYLSRPAGGAGFGLAEWVPKTTVASNAIILDRNQNSSADGNYEQLLLGIDVFDAGFNIYTRAAGSGANRPLILGTANAEAMRIGTTQAISSSTQPRSNATNSAAQSIPTGLPFTSITFDINTTNIGGIHSTSVNPSRFTVPAGGDGWYMAVGEVVWAVAGGGTQKQIRIFKNGTTQLARGSVISVGVTNQDCNVIWQGALAAGDYIEFQAYQDTGAALNTVAGNGNTWGSLVKVW